MPKNRFSLSRLLRSILEHRTPTGLELEVTNELARSITPKWKGARGVPGFLVPSSAFDLPTTRDVTITGTGARQPNGGAAEAWASNFTPANPIVKEISGHFSYRERIRYWRSVIT